MADDNKKLLVSIIIPTCNRGKPLCKTLRSLFRQTYQHYEIIVVDQSTKKFPEKERFLKENKNKIRYFYLTKPSIPKAINLGIKKAKGEIIFLTDDDVLAKQDLLEKHIVNYDDTKVSGVLGRVVTKGQPEDPDFVGVGKISSYGTVSGGFSSKIKQEVGNVIGCNVSFRKKILEKIGGVDENFIGNALRWETDLAMRIKKLGGRIIFEPKAEITHVRAKTGGCRMDNRKRWFLDYFHNETYFFLKHFAWWKFPVFWLNRWEWLVRSKSLSVPRQGISDGIKTYKRSKNENWG